MVVWSLFDGSGIMGLPWAQAGHSVYCFNADEADHGEYEFKMEHENIHYIRNGRTCIASMGRFQHEFEPLTKAQAERIAEEIETAEHIEKLRSMRRDRNTQAGTGISVAGTMPRPQTEQRVG